MNDRQPTKPNRIKITFDDGTIKYGYMERADEPTVEGTPLNKATLFDSNATDRYVAETPSEAFNKIANEILVNVPVSGWSADTDADGWYTNQITVADMKAVYSPFMDVIFDNASTAADISSAYSAVQKVETFDGYVILKANRIPADDFTVKFRGV